MAKKKTDLTPVQLVAFQAYDTSLMPIADDPPRARDFNPRICGDHLYSFIMYELDEPNLSLDEALGRITQARLQLQEIERALFAAGRSDPAQATE